MTAKKHDASTRFWHLLERYKSLGAKAHDPDWTNPIEVILRPSLSCTVLPGNPLDDAIAIAFAKTGLNVRDPFHWKFLLALFCLAHFGEWLKPGGKKVWTIKAIERLENDVTEIEAHRPSSLDKLSDSAIAEILKEKPNYKGTYGKYETPSLRQRIREARDLRKLRTELHEKNVMLMRRLNEMLGIEWTSELEAEVRKTSDDIAAKFRGGE